MTSNPPDNSELVYSTLVRALDLFCRGFEMWWSCIDEPTRAKLLNTAVNVNPNFKQQDADRIRRNTSDPVPICNLLSAIGKDYGISEFDPMKVRQFRNILIHKDRTERGTMKYMRVSDAEDFLDAAARVLQKFDAKRELTQLSEISVWVVQELTKSSLGMAEPSVTKNVSHPTTEKPSAPKPLKIDTPPFDLPIRTSAAKKMPVPPELLRYDQLSPDQVDAITQANAWFKGTRQAGGKNKPFVITGPAGSGKTAVLSVIVSRLQIDSNQVVFLAPTGKAVEALKARLPRGWKRRARTLASFLWKWKFGGFNGEDANFVDCGAKPVDPAISLVIVDEASMVTKRDFKALQSYQRVVFVGDANQLPPVVQAAELEDQYGSAGVLDNPDIALRVVHRQDTGSSILRVANAVREEEQPDYGTSSDGRVIHLSEQDAHFGTDQVAQFIDEADVVLTQRNSTRVVINDYVRWRRGYMKSPGDIIPKPGEILVSSANYQHPVTSAKLANGERLIVKDYLRKVQVRPDEPELEEFVVLGYPEGREADTTEWTVSSQMLRGDQIRAAVISTEHVTGPRSQVLRCDWGYALTVHKAQGSEWPSVVVVDDHNPDHNIPMRRWYYVAYSRATERLVILKVSQDTLLFTVSWGTAG